MVIWIETLEYGYLMPVVLLGGIFIIWSFTKPVVALTTIMFLYLHVIERSEGITPIEILFAVYFFGYLAYWFTQELIIRRAVILRSAADILLMAFLVVCFSSLLLILANSGSALKWLREFLTLSGLLLYFPLRDSLRNDKNAKVILGGFLITVVVIILNNLVAYRKMSLAATYLWELVGSRKPIGAHVFFPATVVVMSLIMHVQRVKDRVLLFVIILLCGLGLALTFARGFWFATLIGFVMLFFLVDRPKRKKLLLTSLIALSIAMICIWYFTGGMGESIIRALLIRFTTSGAGLQDISLRERLLESEKVLSLIKESPIIGHGVGASFTLYSILTRTSEESMYVHNGYLFLLFKVGILGTLIFLGYLYFVIINAFRALKTTSAGFFQIAITRGIIAVLAAVAILTISSNYFIEKHSLLILTLSAAFVMSRAGNQNAESIPAIVLNEA
jgi:O-antigen ligase